MATGGRKAIKDLEKEQKTRQTPMIRDGLDAELLDIATFYRDVMMVQAGVNNALINKELETEISTPAEKNKPHSTIKKINAMMEARINLSHNAAPPLTVEALTCVLARQKNPKSLPDNYGISLRGIGSFRENLGIWDYLNQIG
jgi:DNA polymerase-3 subunit delta'